LCFAEVVSGAKLVRLLKQREAWLLSARGASSLSRDGLEREFRFFNWLEGCVCTTCAPGDQEKSCDSHCEQGCGACAASKEQLRLARQRCPYPEWTNDPAYLEWLVFTKKYYPEGDIADQLNFTGWNVAVLMTRLIEDCGDDLSPQNLMKQATTLKNVPLPGLIPGITVSSSPDDYPLIKALRPQCLDGERWVPMSGTMTAR